MASNCIADLLFKVESPLLLQYVETKANLSLRFGIKQLDDYLEQQVGCAFLHWRLIRNGPVLKKGQSSTNNWLS